MRWTASRLSKSEKEYLGSLKLVSEESGVTLVHGTLVSPDSFGYVTDTMAAHDTMDLMASAVAFIGHSHVPAVFTMDGGNVSYSRAPEVKISGNKKYLVNAGSVGQPRDGDRRASYCVWDKSAGTLEIKRVEYDVAKAQRKIIEAGLPEFLAERLGSGR